MRLFADVVMDPLTDIFRIMQVRATVQCRVEATAPWGLTSAALSSTHRPQLDVRGISLPESASFAMISRGNCWLTVDGMPDAVELAAGDCILIAPGKHYTLRDDPHTRAANFCDAPVPYDSDVIHHGGGGAPATIIAGLIHFGAASLRFIAQLLPGLVLIRSGQASRIGLDAIFQLLTAEMAKQPPASEFVSTRLAEVLFIQALRAQISNSLQASNPGWLRAIFDPKIGAALHRFHSAIDQRWTVQSLASAAGMSRSAFALRFKQLLGRPPLEYVTEWRMQRAIQLLEDEDRKLADIAQEIGYDSDASFNKAFKRVLGNTPREYIRQALSHS